MPRSVLDPAALHPAIRDIVAKQHADILQEVMQAVAGHAVVVVGMAQNPYPKQARRALDAAGVPHHDLDYGSYFSQWRRRTALKMWSGWTSFPMVFVKGQLVGGAKDLQRLIDSGELKRMLG